MRRIFIMLMVALSMAAPLSAQAVAITPPVQVGSPGSTDTVQRRDVGEQVTAVIDHIAKKLEVPAKEVYRVLTKQGLVVGLSNVVWAGLWIVLITLYWTRVRKMFMRDENTWHTDSDGDPAPKIAFYAIGSLLTLFMGMGAAACLDEAVRYAVNPEYFAFEKIIDALKGVTR